MSRLSAREMLLARLGVLGCWLGLVLFMTARHAYWRDEVRALSIALQGGGVVDMLRGLHGEGHPAVWYLLLRGAHAVLGGPVALPAVAVAVATASAALLLFASPFPLWLAAVLLFGGPLLFEYAVVARNYGVAAPPLFLFAACYRSRRERGVVLGVLAAVLANTNAHAMLLVGALFLLWLLDLAGERRLSWPGGLRRWAVNAAIAGVGVVLCCLTIYPPFNDAAVTDGGALTLRALAGAVLLPGSSFTQLLAAPVRALDWGPISDYGAALPYRLLSAVMVGALLGLVRWPAALAAGAASLLGLSLFFVVAYPGYYRHQALWLLFLIALYWMAQVRGSGPLAAGGGGTRQWAGRVGFACFVALMAAQVPVGLRAVVEAQPGRAPYSQVRALAAALRSRADLADAILLPDPDYLLEALPYYTPAPIYLPRAEAFAAYAKFQKRGVLDLSLGTLLDDARTLCRTRARPVVIVLRQDLERLGAPATVKEGYNWHLSWDAADVAALRSSTEFLGRFEPALTDETFGVYVLRPPC